jgi:1-acyl-sn-glycerol-3-phosphate acyltransferase
LVLPLAFRIRIIGRENFPEQGPLLVVGNHVAAMEAVLMVVFSPWQVEMLGSVDIPPEKVTVMAMNLFGCIPIMRGQTDRTAMRKALDVLRQGGVMGIFPEGGFWQAGAMPPQTGVAWLSSRAAAPVLPIGFHGTWGALGAALRLKRPCLTMQVGQLLPAARLPEGKARKVYLQEYAAQVMEAVTALLPADDPARQPRVVDERFELKVEVQELDGTPSSCPPDLVIRHPIALAKFLHQPGVLKIFLKNLRMSIGPLQDLRNERDPRKIADAVRPVLGYLRDENPYLLSYRFGAQEGGAMQAGLDELLALARWAAELGLSLKITPIRRYYSPQQGEDVEQIEQGTFGRWM